MPGNQWKLPLNLAIGFHVLVAFCTIYLPNIFDSKPRYEDIYTVNLINMAEPAPAEPAQPAAPPEPQASPPPATEPPPSENAVSIAEKPPEPVVAPPKAISIKPTKKKVKKEVEKKVEPKVTKPDESVKKRQQLAEAIRAQREAEEQAKVLAEEAALERKLLEEARNRPSPSRTPTNAKGAGPAQPSGSSNLNSVEKQYYATLTARLQSLWSLPEYKNWDPNLSAKVVITITQDGAIVDSFFESRSGDRIFDSFVTKTIESVGTLPPIPPVLKKQRMEVGLVFTPGRIQ